MIKKPISHLNNSECIGQFRLKIIGGLLASPPQKGDLKNQLTQLSEKSWFHPLSGERVHYSIPTLERWYYKSKNEDQNQLNSLGTVLRDDKGTFKSLKQSVCDVLEAQYAEHDGWSKTLSATIVTTTKTKADMIVRISTFWQAQGRARRY